MKFFDPKKKENENPVSNNPPSASPSASPQSAPTIIQPRPVIPPPEATPTVSIPAPAPPKPAEKPPQPAAAVTEPKLAPAANRISQTIFGPSVAIKGEVHADETIIVDGTIEGTLETTRDIFVGAEGKVHADIRATNIIISGKVKGDVTATTKVELAPYGTLEGNIHAPRLTVSETSLFRGRINMSAPESKAAHKPDKEKKPSEQQEIEPSEKVT